MRPCSLAIPLTGSHSKPWEAVLLIELVDYLSQHFLQPCASALPLLKTVRCRAVRLPVGQLIRAAGFSSQGHGRAAASFTQAQGSGGGGSRGGGSSNVVLGGRFVEVPGYAPAPGPGEVKGAETLSAKWRVCVSERIPLQHAAKDGLEMEECNVVFTLC